MSPTLFLIAALAGQSPDAAKASPPIRIADVISGHIHPALAVTRSGTLLAVYNKQGGGGKELLLCRSTDGGRTWTPPAVVPGIKDCSIYPGSLTVLSDGRLLLAWACYRYPPAGTPEAAAKVYHRTAHYLISSDEGVTWGEAQKLPIADPTSFTCLRYPLLELMPHRWVWPLYDRTVEFDETTRRITPFGDGRNHGMVGIVRTPQGTLLSGAPYEALDAVDRKLGKPAGGLRSTDGGQTWEALHQFPPFGVAGYDLTVLPPTKADPAGRVVLTSIIYENMEKAEGERSYEMSLSHDDGKTWDREHALKIYDPGRRIPGRGWPRTVLVDKDTLGTIFFDLDANQPGGPGLFFIRTPIRALEK